jgi:serine phosphatase RsbU (regulator of sigma subunit)
VDRRRDPHLVLAVIADVRGHIGEHQVYDDITLVVVKQR